MDGKEADVLRSFLRTFLENADAADRMVAMLHWADGLSPLEIGIVLDRSEDEITRRLAAVRDGARAALRAGATSETVARTIA